MRTTTAFNQIAVFQIAVFLLLVFNCHAASPANEVVIDMHRVTPDGVGEKVGTLTLGDTPEGLKIVPNIKGISPGPHGFHVHEKPSCQPALKNGKPSAAEAAGPHFDPDKSGKHQGPGGHGHKGDLPYLEADDKGEIKKAVTSPNLKLEQILNRSIIIHDGGDNYSDNPKPLGGGGGRWACGLISR